MPPPSASPVTRSAQTTIVNPVELVPFQVLNVTCPERWDPSAGVLPVTWEINDPNERIRAGRILYQIRNGESLITIHRQSLTAGQWTPGDHQLPLGNRWDGNIDEGLPERNGERITADLSTLRVQVQVWNTTESEPAEPSPDGGGRTQRTGEYESHDQATVAIDAIVEARWEKHWVIPYDDPEEPDRGKSEMIIRVKNVRENTPVHILVRRINEIPDPASDYPYADDADASLQPGLHDLVVHGNRVELRAGGNPYCQFNNFNQHWIHEGNNFYCFAVQFADGQPMAASERDYVGSESACLHMRFTVFIHVASSEIAVDVTTGRQLHNFFRNSTRYYRSYLMVGAPSSLQNWFNHFKHRYIVVFDGHGACGCLHPDHPSEPMPHPAHGHAAAAAPATRKVQLYHSGFDPDRYVCPDAVLDTAEARASVAQDEQHYHCHFAGCANAEEVYSQVCLGRIGGHPSVLNARATGLPADRIVLYTSGDTAGGALAHSVVLNGTAPRMYFYNGGCRGILTPALGHKFTDQEFGTRYYSGFVYSVAADAGDQHVMSLFTRWIQGTSSDPAPNEFDTSRIETAFREASALGQVGRYHPRLMNSGGILTGHAAPDSTETALA